MEAELKTALETLAKDLEGKANSTVKETIEKSLADLDGLYLKAEEKAALESQLGELKSANEALQNHLDAMDIKMKEAEAESKSGHTVEAYTKALTGALKENFAEIKSMGKGKSVQFEMKAMTLTASLTGDPVKTYQSGVIALPGQRINIADLVPVVQSSTGVYVYYVETPAPTTPASKVCTENTAKPEVDFTLVEKTCNACYIAGITRFSKQMAQDLPFPDIFPSYRIASGVLESGEQGFLYYPSGSRNGFDWNGWWSSSDHWGYRSIGRIGLRP